MLLTIAVVLGLRWNGENLFQITGEGLYGTSQRLAKLVCKLHHGDRVRFAFECGVEVRALIV